MDNDHKKIKITLEIVTNSNNLDLSNLDRIINSSLIRLVNDSLIEAKSVEHKVQILEDING